MACHRYIAEKISFIYLLVGSVERASRRCLASDDGVAEAVAAPEDKPTSAVVVGVKFSGYNPVEELVVVAVVVAVVVVAVVVVASVVVVAVVVG